MPDTVIYIGFLVLQGFVFPVLVDRLTKWMDEKNNHQVKAYIRKHLHNYIIKKSPLVCKLGGLVYLIHLVLYIGLPSKLSTIDKDNNTLRTLSLLILHFILLHFKLYAKNFNNLTKL